MRHRSRTRALPLAALTFLALVSASTAATAQNRPKIPDPVVERAWAEDEDGLRQWKAWDETCTHCRGAKSHVCEHCKDSELPICLECDGTERATCRLCAGQGKLPDPLEQLTCPYCWGASWVRCGLCNSWGSLTVEGQPQACGACKKQGLLPCTACEGERRVEAVRVKRKSPGQAKLKDLRTVREDLVETLELVRAYEPVANPSKSTKTFAKAVDPAEKALPVIDRMKDLLETTVKGVRSYGANFSSYEANLAGQFLIFKDRTVYLLEHQIKLLDLCIARAEFNESVGKERRTP